VLSSVWISVASMIEIVSMGRLSGVAAAALAGIDSEDIQAPIQLSDCLL
jgi:hypothetical protein